MMIDCECYVFIYCEKEYMYVYEEGEIFINSGNRIKIGHMKVENDIGNL
jgi:hypothetical protein